MSIEFTIVILHIIGTILGVGGATMIELHIAQALKDKLFSKDESTFLGIDYRMVRIGLIICVLSGFAFLLLDKFEGKTQYLYSGKLWAKLFIVMFIAGNTLLLQAHAINLYWGSAISFVSWWLAAIVGMFMSNRVQFDFFGTGGSLTTFFSIMLAYIACVILGAVILHYVRRRVATN
ncbi:MAG: hypothetical protein NUW00_00245 [Candidatus Kaiserbacteria bacterium]|nr:hypothetical protein [Candidatus Kaiserbacteria bacterium]